MRRLKERMSSRAASPRVLVLATVVAAHAGALLGLLAETRTRQLRGQAEARPLLVMLLEPRERRASAVSMRAAEAPRAPRFGPPQEAEPETLPPATPASGATIDWAAEATASAARQIEADERHARQARALAPQPSPMFAAPPKRHEFPWDYARTHRVEAVAGLGTVIHLNDQCVLVLFAIIPMLGCTVDKPRVRGDLFEHVHDPDPAPQP